MLAISEIIIAKFIYDSYK